MNFTILDCDHFYSQGLSSVLREHYAEKDIMTNDIAWNTYLFSATKLFIRCRFSVDAQHESLIYILKQLSMKQWTGTVYLLASEHSRALGVMLHNSFTSLQIHIVDDSVSINALLRYLEDPVKSSHTRDTAHGLTSNEFKILSLLISGMPVYMVATHTTMSEKQVSMHKRNALKKLNVTNIIRLLI